MLQRLAAGHAVDHVSHRMARGLIELCEFYLRRSLALGLVRELLSIHGKAAGRAKDFELLEPARQVPTRLEHSDCVRIGQHENGVVVRLREAVRLQLMHGSGHALGQTEVPDRPNGAVDSEVHQSAGAVPLGIRQPFEEHLALEVTRRRAAVADNPVQSPRPSDLALGRQPPEFVVRRPPCHLVVRHDLDPVLAGQFADPHRVAVRPGQRLLEDHVDAERREELDDLQVPIVLHEGPHDIRVSGGYELAVVRGEVSVGLDLPRGFDQLRNGLRHAHKVGPRYVRDVPELSPAVAVAQPDETDLDSLRRCLPNDQERNE